MAQKITLLATQTAIEGGAVGLFTLSSSLNIIDVSNHLPTGTVSISDSTPEQNQTLTASHTRKMQTV